LCAVLCFVAVAVLSSGGCKKKKKKFPYIPLSFQISTKTLPESAVGAPYSVQLQAKYGTAPYQNWAITSGSLPAGFSLDSVTGIISGVAQTAGNYPITIQVEDSSSTPKTAGRDFTISVINAEWTIFVFMNGDNHLEGAAITDINEMEAAGGSTPRLNIIVQCDRHPEYDTSNGDWTTCKRYYVTSDSANNNIVSTELADLGEVNMGTQAALQQFLEWGIGRFTATKYALVFWNHGSTWQCYGHDDTDNDTIDINESYFAIDGALTTTGLAKIDFLGFDMCLVGTVEMLAEFYDVCDVLVASAELEPGHGWNYAASIGYLGSNPTATAQQLATKIVQDYTTRCELQGENDNTLAAFDTANITTFLSDLEILTGYLRSNIGTEGINLGLARSYTDTFTDGEQGENTAADIGDMLYTLRYITSDATLQNYIDSFLTSLSGITLLSRCGTRHEYASGISVFFPEEEQDFLDQSAEYSVTWFAGNYSWDELLVDYYSVGSAYVPTVLVNNVMASSPTVTQGSPVTVSGDVSGDGIADVYGGVYLVSGNILYLYYREPIHSQMTLPNGKTIENYWSSSSVWNVDFEWDAIIPVITDGIDFDFMLFDYDDDVLIVYGQFSDDGGTNWYECAAVFDQTGAFAGLVVFFNGQVVEYDPETGDIFRPYQYYIDVSIPAEGLDVGQELYATDLSLVAAQAPSGTYCVDIEATDFFDNSDDDFDIVTVP